MNDGSVYNLFRKENEIFENYKKKSPELFKAKVIPEKELLARIGINYPFTIRPKGYLRLFPQDFIVEELSENNELSEIEPKETHTSPQTVPFTIFANLVKVGISTAETILYLSRYLETRPEKIHTSGLKDIKAVTSQKIAFPNVDDRTLERIKDLFNPNFFLTNFSFGKGTIVPGQLSGNRFTIFIRTGKELEKQLFLENLEMIRNKGFLNFYHTQRFGTPRFLSHILGRLIAEGNYQKAITTFLFEPGLKGIPLIDNIRMEAKKFFPNWKRVEKPFQELPYTFRNELRLISYLKQNPNNLIGALFFIKDQTTIWVYAFSSYLFNLLISLDGELKLPEKIPLFLSNDLRDLQIYKLLSGEETGNFQNNLKPFPFIVLKRRFIKTRVYPQKILFKVLPEGLILSFILEKGAYATNFLMNLFEIETGEPIPDWVKSKEYDIKRELKTGSIEKVKEILGEEIFDFQKQKIEDIDS